jgi:mannosyltransferase
MASGRPQYRCSVQEQWTSRTAGRPVLSSIVVGLVAAVVSFLGAWNSPAGVDEAATMSAARRSLPELWHMAHNVDGVHSTYYALMHLWFGLVPYDLALLRLPSAVVIGVGAGLLVVLARRITGSSHAAVAAGLVFAVLPRTTSAGLQGRSYAFSMMLAIALALVFVLAADRTIHRRAGAWALWLGYAVVALLGSYMFLYSALLVVAQGVTMLIWLGTRRQQGAVRRAVVSWLVAAAVAGAGVVPLVLMTSGQASKQLYWIGTKLELNARLANSVLVQQNFGDSARMAYVCGALMLVGLVTAFAVPSLRTRIVAVEIALPAVVLPIVAVIAVSVLVQPLYNSRYLTFTTPFVALLIAMGITVFRWRVVSLVAVVVGVALVAALAAPTWVQQRQALHKSGSHWAATVDYITRERAELPDVGADGVWYGPLPGHPIRTTEYVASSYPDAFAGMKDLTLVRSGASIGELWAERTPLHRLPSTVEVDRIWYVGGLTSKQPTTMRRLLEANRWHEETRKQIQGFYVITFERNPRPHGH